MKKAKFVCKRKKDVTITLAVDGTGDPVADRKGMVNLDKMYMGSFKVNEYIIARDFMKVGA